MQLDAASDWLLNTRLARCLADAVFRRRARRRLASLDEVSPERAQLQTLLGHVHLARNTRFGLDHDFARIRSADDFRRLVPLRAPRTLWQEYGAPALPRLDNVLWPGRFSYLATCDTGNGHPSPPLPVSVELVNAHKQALWTALAQVVYARPDARLLSGTLLLVGGNNALTPLRGGQIAKDNLGELVAGQLPRLFRPYISVAPYSGDAPLRALADRAYAMKVTCLLGNTSRLAKLAEFLKELTGCATLAEVWPGLQAVLYSRGAGDPDRLALTQIVGGESSRAPMMLEACVRPEGVLAVEDPRWGRPRVMADHGVYFEFVPVEELGQPRPARLGLGEVQAGVPYAVAVTSAAGAWAALVGWTVCFERTVPPLLQSVDGGLPETPPAEILALPGPMVAPARVKGIGRLSR